MHRGPRRHASAGLLSTVNPVQENRPVSAKPKPAAPAPPAAAPPVPFVDLVELLVQGGQLTPDQVAYAKRIQSKLVSPKPLLDILKELKLITDEQVKQAVRTTDTPMGLGNLLVALGHLRESDLALALTIQSESPAAQASGRNPARAPVGRRAHADRGALAADGLPLRGPRLRRDRPQALQPRAAQVVRESQLRADADGERDPAGRLRRPHGQGRARPRRGRCSAPTSPWRSPGAARSSGDQAHAQRPPAGAHLPLRREHDHFAGQRHRSPRRSNARRATSTSNRSRSTSACASARTACSSTTTTSRSRSWGPITNRLKVMCDVDITEKRRHQGGRFFFEHGDRPSSTCGPRSTSPCSR